MVSKTQKDWDIKLAHSESAYNHHTYATGRSPFEIVYGLNPHVPLDLLPMPAGELVHRDVESKLKAMLKLHQQVHDRIVEVNAVYQRKSNKHKSPRIFKEGDMVWVNLRKERFPSKRKNKLMPRTDGPFKVTARVNDNAYKVELPGEYGVHATFNVGDLSPYLDDDGLAELRSIPFKEGGDDTGKDSSNSSSITTVGYYGKDGSFEFEVGLRWNHLKYKAPSIFLISQIKRIISPAVSVVIFLFTLLFNGL